MAQRWVANPRRLVAWPSTPGIALRLTSIERPQTGQEVLPEF